MATDCTIVIPVYNAFEEALACLQSVLLHTPEAQEIFVIDDASPSGDFSSYIEGRINPDPRLKVTRNPKNLGFVKSCNLGMEHCYQNDVVLLNSDTLVTAGWLSKMQRAACSRPDVGTVTPLTNNGTICSVPRFLHSNQIPEGYTLDEFSALVEQVSSRQYPILPTCVGFCVYIRRSALNAGGLFNAEAFGKGYGEENDLSCRLQQKGFVDILDDATYIFHQGSASFGEEKELLGEKNSAVMRRRHPHYFSEVAKFCATNPLRPVHENIESAMIREWTASRKASVLHLLQNGPFVERNGTMGGTEVHVRNLIEHGQEYANWSLVPSRGYLYLTAHLPDFDREYVIPNTGGALNDILHIANFDLVHLHHIWFFKQSELTEALLRHGNFVVSIHDYVLICPRFHLYTVRGKVCNGHECVSTCGYTGKFIGQYRALGEELLKQARAVICFSESSREYLHNVVKAPLIIQRMSHGITGFKAERRHLDVQEPSKESPLKVLLLGHVLEHKGASIFESIAEAQQLNGVKVEWHVLGKVFKPLPPQVIQHGEYSAAEVVDKISAIAPHLVLILSRCPETYSLTLDEAWNSGVPAVVTPIGAPAERVRDSGAGWVLPELSAKAVLETLKAITSNWAEYLEKRAAVNTSKVRPANKEAEDIGALYSEMVKQVQESGAILQYVKEAAIAQVPRQTVTKRALGKLINRGLHFVEKIHVRPSLERVAVRILPEKVINDLKILRHRA